MFVVRWLPGADRVARPHRAAGQQLDDLCGVHWASILLASDGIVIDAESLAVEAGTILPAGDTHASVPPGVEPRRDYGRSHPTTRAQDAGTPVLGLIDAVKKASSGSRALVPLRTAWDEERVDAVVRLCLEHPSWEMVPLANVGTEGLWGSHLPLMDAFLWLAGAEVEPPAPDWDVGHFVTIAGTLEGSDRAFLIVRDSYPGFGWDAHHLQPPEAMAAALRRDEGREGGIALYVAEDDRPEVELAAKSAGFQIEGWDNGTPWPRVRDEGGADR